MTDLEKSLQAENLILKANKLFGCSVPLELWVRVL